MVTAIIDNKKIYYNQNIGKWLYLNNKPIKIIPCKECGNIKTKSIIDGDYCSDCHPW